MNWLPSVKSNVKKRKMSVQSSETSIGLIIDCLQPCDSIVDRDGQRLCVEL